MSSITDAVAFVRDPHQDLVITNDLGRAFYSPIIGEGGRTPNLARFLFLDPVALAFYPDWDFAARVCVGAIGAEVKRDPFCPRIQQLVGELFMRSDAFPSMWAAQVLHTLSTGMQRFCHPVVGELTMACEEFTVTAAPGLVMSIYTAEPGSRSAERLRLLASWAAVAPADAPRP